jgi:hypothetical protein
MQVSGSCWVHCIADRGDFTIHLEPTLFKNVRVMPIPPQLLDLSQLVDAGVGIGKNIALRIVAHECSPPDLFQFLGLAIGETMNEHHGIALLGGIASP